MRRYSRLTKKKIFITMGLSGLFLLLGWVLFNQPEKSEIQPRIKLYIQDENCIEEMGLEDYVKGTLAAEMPASFENEALKAQAVAIRTYTLRRLLSGIKYPLGADMSDDINSCQAYIGYQEFKQRHPYQSEKLWAKLAKAVEETSGEVLLFENQPIDAVYSSTCGGRTASASESWAKDIAYLKSVNCDYCKNSKHYSEVLVFSNMDLGKIWGETGSNPKVQVLKTSPSGRVKEIKVNKQIMSGEEFRKALNLPSSKIKIKSNAKELIINSRGYGHGIGLCQYGANGMAEDGKKYRQILQSYYQGVEFYKLNY